MKRFSESVIRASRRGTRRSASLVRLSVVGKDICDLGSVVVAVTSSRMGRLEADKVLQELVRCRKLARRAEREPVNWQMPLLQ